MKNTKKEFKQENTVRLRFSIRRQTLYEQIKPIIQTSRLNL